MNIRFFYLDTVLCTEQAGCLLFLLCCFRLGEILHGNAFAGVCFDVLPLRHLGYFHIPYKAIVDYDSLRSVFTCTLCFKHINVVYKFPQQRCSQGVHSQKIADCLSEVLAFLFALSAFGNLLPECFYLCFQFQPFYLVFVRQLHNPFVANLADRVVLPLNAFFSKTT